MREVVVVKQLRIGEGRPKVCVPIVGKTKEDILAQAVEINAVAADLVEWRVDFFEDVQDVVRVNEVLVALRDALNEMPLLFTFRSLKEGGEVAFSVADYINLIKAAIETKFIDLVDVELLMGDDVVSELVERAHEVGVKVVISNHDFNKTPTQADMVKILCQMQDLGADLPKLAVMPQGPNDVLPLLAASHEMVTRYAKTPIITMSMGSLGVVSRIAGETFGSAITFGSVNKASAPGQIPAQTLVELLEILHNEN